MGNTGFVNYVLSAAWSPNRQYLAFRADKEEDNVEELYVVSIPGGEIVKVSGTMTAGGDVNDDFSWAPDSSRIALYCRPGFGWHR